MIRVRTLFLTAVVATTAVAHPALQTQAIVDVAPLRPDYLSIAQGAVPVRVSGAAAQLGAGDEQALRVIDGNWAAFTIASGMRADGVAEFVYELPAPTTFDRFAVPNVLESPAPTSTFVRNIEVFGSALSPDTGMTLLASAVLTAHARRGDATELTLGEAKPVRWIRLRLSGGLDTSRPETALEFTELVGNGSQEPSPLLFRFRGEWGAGTNVVALRQQGSVVSGCYDTAGELTGTVSGNVLRAVGTNRTDRVRSAFVLSVSTDGTIRGLRATGPAAFRTYVASKNMPGGVPRCTPPPVTLGCGALVHAVPFADDGETLRPDPGGVLTALAEGLGAETARTVVVESHVSVREGPAAIAQAHSERRAQAVVAELAHLGVPAERLRAVGAGNSRPILAGDDDASAAINRRFEIRCQP